jgi:hypothetical protein
MSELHQSTLEHIRTQGWIRVKAAYSPDEAAAMCDVIWRTPPRPESVAMILRLGRRRDRITFSI